MFKINPNSSVPVYEQIEQNIIEYIILGILKPHDVLPSVRNVAKELGINPNTVSKAYSELDNKNITYSIAGKGIYVNENTEIINTYLRNLKVEFKDLYEKLIKLGCSKEDLYKLLEGGVNND
ncbi:MAG: GntR family transcriptional regulator [Erysipelotrichales bacterium]|nr:GntR family transcriptional regulator [Erysipelotrichales bacterium]